MIFVEGTRQKPYEFFRDTPPRHKRTVGSAIGDLFRFELGFGGRVTEISPTRLVVQTRVFSCVDTMIFEGDEESMAPLLLGVHAFYQLRNNNEVMQKDVDRIMEVTKGNPLMVSMSGPLFNGPVSRVAAMVAAGLSEDEMKLAAKLDVEDFYAALDLKLETGQPLETIV